MSENENAVANGAEQAGAVGQVAIQKIYVRDSSFEVPNAPMIFQEQGQPNIQLNIGQKVQQLADAVFEVVLTVTVTCKIADKTAYLAEVQQAGIFTVSGFDQPSTHAVLNTFCPSNLYPFARQAICELTVNGGFPPFLLQPLNFDQMYADQMRRREAAGNA